MCLHCNTERLPVLNPMNLDQLELWLITEKNGTDTTIICWCRMHVTGGEDAVRHANYVQPLDQLPVGQVLSAKSSNAANA